MTVSLTRRTLGTAFAGLLATGLGRAAAAATPGALQFETDVWTGSVLMDQGGRSFVLRDLEQPVTLLKLWTGGCPACAVELPQLAAMASAFGRAVEVILVSHPQFWAADQAAARRRKLPFRLATFAPSNPAPLMDQALLGQEGVFSVPKSFVFAGRNRSIVMKRESATDWGSEAMMGRIKALVG